MAATCERDCDCDCETRMRARTRNFCAQSESDCDTNELFWLSPLPTVTSRSPFSVPPARFPLAVCYLLLAVAFAAAFAGRWSSGRCLVCNGLVRGFAYLCAYFFYVKSSTVEHSLPPPIPLGMQIYGVSRNNCYCVFNFCLICVFK